MKKILLNKFFIILAVIIIIAAGYFIFYPQKNLTNYFLSTAQGGTASLALDLITMGV